jgi:hypothetical protein
MSKKEKIMKNFVCTEIQNIKGYNSWIACTMDNGERLTSPFTLLFKLLDLYEINAEKVGNRYRAVEFYRELKLGSGNT